jgi:hypothetical protein
MRSVFARLIEGRSLFDLAVANWRHATEEFTVLSSFLSARYSEATTAALRSEEGASLGCLQFEAIAPN